MTPVKQALPCFKNLIKALQAGAAITLLDSYRRTSIQLLKIEAAKCYLHGVQLARLSAIGLMRMGLLIGLVCVGVVLFHAGLFMLLPWSMKAKALLAMLLGCAYAVSGCVALHAATDEGVWMEKSGVANMLKETTGQSE